MITRIYVWWLFLDVMSTSRLICTLIFVLTIILGYTYQTWYSKNRANYKRYRFENRYETQWMEGVVLLKWVQPLYQVFGRKSDAGNRKIRRQDHLKPTLYCICRKHKSTLGSSSTRQKLLSYSNDRSLILPTVADHAPALALQVSLSSPPPPLTFTILIHTLPYDRVFYLYSYWSNKLTVYYKLPFYASCCFLLAELW